MALIGDFLRRAFMPPLTTIVPPLRSGSHLTNQEVHERMWQGGTKKPFIEFTRVHNNEILVIPPKKYTVPKGTQHLFCEHRDFPDHVVSINRMVEDGYTCVVHARDCKDTIINVRPGFDNDETIVIYKNPLLNKEAAKHALKKWDSD